MVRVLEADRTVVPLPFININENVSFKLFGTIGNQSVQRYINYGIPNNNYWDWQLGATATVWGVDLTVAYTDTNSHSNTDTDAHIERVLDEPARVRRLGYSADA